MTSRSHFFLLLLTTTGRWAMGAWALLLPLPLLPLLAAVAAAAQQVGGAATTMRLTASLDLAATPTAFHHTWEASVGSSHAAMGLREDWRAHLRMAVRDCGFRGIRMHGIFDDDMSVVFPPCTFPPCKKHGASGGPRPQPTYSWFNVDSLYDFLINQLHIQPVVELSFMPQALAGCWPNPHGAKKRPFLRQFFTLKQQSFCQDRLGTNTKETHSKEGFSAGSKSSNMTPCVYGQHYMEIRMPPGRASLQPSGYYNGPAVADYGIWYNLVAAFAQHLVQRYGDDAPQFYEVRKTVLFVRFYT
jgi:hypothetical protein